MSTHDPLAGHAEEEGFEQSRQFIMSIDKTMNPSLKGHHCTSMDRQPVKHRKRHTYKPEAVQQLRKQEEEYIRWHRLR
jgi:hypothetical protein